MKKKILLLIGVFAFGLMQAQVGINTTNPIGIFHIDPKGNSNSATPSTLEDDIIIDADGNVGAGTIPSSKLDIKGKLMYEDGNQSPNYVLRSSDNTGDAYWANLPELTLKEGELVTSGTISSNLSSFTDITSSFLELEPGPWLIFAKFVTNRTGATSYVVWAEVFDATNNLSLVKVGALPEGTGGILTTPQITYLHTFTATTKIIIRAATEATNTIINNGYGGSNFYAIKLQ